MKEEEIRNKEVFERYVTLLADDARKLLADESSFETIACPACEAHECTEEMEKLGFKYVSCKHCGTLFVNPRPSFEALKQFYVRSQSAHFWVNEFFAPFAEARSKKIFEPRAQFVARRFGNDPRWLIGDVGAGFGLFLEEMRKLWPESDYVAVEPSLEMAEICRHKGFKVQNVALEDMSQYKGQFGLLTAFELFEHLSAPKEFLRGINSLLRPEGCFLVTTLNGQGFDIQLLWEKSRSICPPQHLNFFNTKSIVLLLESCGFLVEEVATPGSLDWDIVEGMIKDRKANPGKFWQFVADTRGETCKGELQEWIVRNDLSSHMRVIARKKKPYVAEAGLATFC